MNIIRKRITLDYIYISLSNSTTITLFKGGKYLGISLPNKPVKFIKNNPKYYQILKTEKNPENLYNFALNL